MDRDKWVGIAWLAGIFIVIMLLQPLCTPKVVIPPDPNVELAKAARDAIAMAREAGQEAASVRASSDRWYFISLAAAVTVPLVVALLLLRYYAKTPPDDGEVLMQLERLAEEERRKLPPPSGKELVAPPEHGGSTRRT